MYKNYNMTQLTLPIETSLEFLKMIFRDMLMKLLKRYLIANSMNSDIIVVQHLSSKNDVKIILYAYTQSVFSGRRIENYFMTVFE